MFLRQSRPPGPVRRQLPVETFHDQRENGRLQAALFLLAVAFRGGLLGPFPLARVVELVDTQVSEAPNAIFPGACSCFLVTLSEAKTSGSMVPVVPRCAPILEEGVEKEV